MDERILALNAEVNRLSFDLLATADESWSEIQRQTVQIIQEATERMTSLVDTVPNGDPEHWLHDLRSPSASMLSAVTLLLDEADYTPSHLDLARVGFLREKIIELREAIDELANERQGL